MADAVTPHETMILVIQRRALTRRKIKVAGNLEDEIAEEENSRAEPERGLAQPDFAVHLQCRESNVDAIEVGDDVEREEEREQALPDFGKRRPRVYLDVTLGS